MSKPKFFVENFLAIPILVILLFDVFYYFRLNRELVPLKGSVLTRNKVIVHGSKREWYYCYLQVSKIDALLYITNHGASPGDTIETYVKRRELEKRPTPVGEKALKAIIDENDQDAACKMYGLTVNGKLRISKEKSLLLDVYRFLYLMNPLALFIINAWILIVLEKHGLRWLCYVVLLLDMALLSWWFEYFK